MLSVFKYGSYLWREFVSCLFLYYAVKRFLLWRLFLALDFLVQFSLYNLDKTTSRHFNSPNCTSSYALVKPQKWDLLYFVHRLGTNTLLMLVSVTRLGDTASTWKSQGQQTQRALQRPASHTSAAPSEIKKNPLTLSHGLQAEKSRYTIYIPLSPGFALLPPHTPIKWLD